MAEERASYGYDAPGVMRGLLAAGAGLVLAGLALGWALSPGWVGGTVAAAGLAPLAPGAAMLAYSRAGKMRLRDRMLAELDWRGDEQVLDVGTGAGLLLVAAAKRLTTGRAVGVDVWAAKDLSGDARASAERNARIEGVSDRVDILSADARALPLPDASIDRVLSLLCLHNIQGREGQARACAEIARVLRPGGVALIGDYVPVRAYADAFRAAGLDVGPSRACFGTALGPAWLVRAEKPRQA